MGEKNNMDIIKILWLDSNRKERASFEMVAGDITQASRIFVEMVDCLNHENEGQKEAI